MIIFPLIIFIISFESFYLCRIFSLKVLPVSLFLLMQRFADDQALEKFFYFAISSVTSSTADSFLEIRWRGILFFTWLLVIAKRTICFFGVFDLWSWKLLLFILLSRRISLVFFFLVVIFLFSIFAFAFVNQNLSIFSLRLLPCEKLQELFWTGKLFRICWRLSCQIFVAIVAHLAPSNVIE